MRAELSEAVSRLMTAIDFTREPSKLTGDERDRLVSLASFVARCRSSVERDGYSREIDLIPDPEAPGRLCLVPHFGPRSAGQQSGQASVPATPASVVTSTPRACSSGDRATAF